MKIIVAYSIESSFELAIPSGTTDSDREGLIGAAIGKDLEGNFGKIKPNVTVIVIPEDGDESCR